MDVTEPKGSPATAEALLPPPRELPALRAEIDALDAKIVDALNARAALAVEVGRRKALEGGVSTYAPARESAVLARVRELGAGGAMPPSALEVI
jgi:chorismate mutase / prephenate dehydratase